MTSKLVATHIQALKAAQNTPDVQEQLAKIPIELYPAVNRIAAGIALTLGWSCGEDFDFLTSKNPRKIEFCRLAVVSLAELQDFCLDYWGTSLDGLIPQDEASKEEVV